MFTRFRETASRLQVSLIETRRLDGRVCQTHVAGLGAIGFPPADRIAFWTKLHQRLATLANRIDGATRGAILAAVHARIPMPTRDDQRAVQLDNARTDARVWEALSDAQADRIAGLKGLAAHAAQAVAKAEPAAAKAADAARKAAERLARAEQGEDVGGGGMPLTHKGFLKITDMTKAEARDCERVAEIVERGGSQLLADEQLRRHRKVDKAVVRELHRLLLP